MPYNVLSCAGFAAEQGGYVASASCLKGRLGFVLLFFIIAIVRKWGGEEIGIEFNPWFAFIGGLVGYFVVITLFGSFTWAFISGLGIALVLGYGGGLIFDSMSGGDY